ncbi:hypothetical protein GCM10027051_03220 [Niabella terrae]
MTTNFSFKRLLQLTAKHWAEHRRFYLMSTLALLGLLAIVFAIWLLTDGTHYEESNLYGVGLFGLFIIGAIFASNAFSMLGTKDKAIYWISFPASHLEKLLVVLFFNVIVFSLIYIVCFYLLKTLAMTYVDLMISREPHRFSLNPMDWTRPNGFGQVLPYFLYAFFGLQAAYLLGAASFKRFSFIITTIMVALLIFLVAYYTHKIYSSGFKGYNFNIFELSENYSTAGDEGRKVYTIPGYLKSSILFFLQFLIAPLLWLVTWFKLKEKQC